MTETLRVGRRAIKLSSPDKLLFPEAGLTKRDLASYWERAAEVALPHLRGRPLNLHRMPDGVEGKGFFQQHASDWFPDWVERARVPKRGGSVDHVVANRADTLVYLAGQNVVALHAWPSRADKLDHPDRIVFDLDPPEGDFARVRAAARLLGDVLRDLGLEPFAMVTGSKGIHVVAPIRRDRPFKQVRPFARGVAEVLVEHDPKNLTLEWLKADRGGRILVDVRTTRGMSVVAPYSVRAKPEAPVAAPLAWDELSDSRLTPRRFTAKNLFRRLDSRGDPWAQIAGSARSLGRAERALAAKAAA